MFNWALHNSCHLSCRQLKSKIKPSTVECGFKVETIHGHHQSVSDTRSNKTKSRHEIRPEKKASNLYVEVRSERGETGKYHEPLRDDDLPIQMRRDEKKTIETIYPDCLLRLEVSDIIKI